MQQTKDYSQCTDEQLISLAAERFKLDDMWKMLAKNRMTLPEKRESMREKIIAQLKKGDEYGLS